MPTQERAVATRASIVQGAAVVFNDRGYANASLEVIAEASQVTRGALYFHFKTKEELANAVIAAQHQASRTDAEKTLAQAQSAVEGMILMCVALARQLVSEVIVSAGIRLTTDGTARELSAEDPYRDWMRTFETLLRLGIDQGDVKPDVDPVRAAEYIIPSYTGLQLVSDTLHDRSDLFDRVRDMWVFLLPGLIRPERLAAAMEMVSLVKRRG